MFTFGIRTCFHSNHLHYMPLLLLDMTLETVCWWTLLRVAFLEDEPVLLSTCSGYHVGSILWNTSRHVELFAFSNFHHFNILENMQNHNDISLKHRRRVGIMLFKFKNCKKRVVSIQQFLSYLPVCCCWIEFPLVYPYGMILNPTRERSASSSRDGESCINFHWNSTMSRVIRHGCFKKTFQSFTPMAQSCWQRTTANQTVGLTYLLMELAMKSHYREATHSRLHLPNNVCFIGCVNLSNDIILVRKIQIIPII